MKKNERGIMLIDLMVIVAFITILAAILLPQLSVFTVRSSNAAAATDLRNAIAAQQTLYLDYRGYGFSSLNILPAAGGTGAGSVLFGPLPPATSTTTGGALTMGPALGPPMQSVVGIGLAVSSGVALRADMFEYSTGPLIGYGSSYIITAKHMMGDTAYAAETEKESSIYLCRNTSPLWVGIPGLAMVMVPSATEWPDLGNTPCGGTEIMNWTELP